MMHKRKLRSMLRNAYGNQIDKKPMNTPFFNEILCEYQTTFAKNR